MNSFVQLSVDPITQNVSASHPNPTPSVIWDGLVQAAVRATAPGPTIASRAYGILHTAMYDAWAAYDANAIATTGIDVQRPAAEKTETNLKAAMSFAAYRVLSDLFPSQQDLFDRQMVELGLDAQNNTVDTTTAVGIGNAAAAALLNVRHTDGANQLNGYLDNVGYTPVNANGNEVIQLDKWTPELLGQPGNLKAQKFLTPQWGAVTPFALNDKKIAEFRPVAPKPFLLVEGATVDLDRAMIRLESGEEVAISREIVGTLINPEFIEQTERVVEISANLTDKQKLIAEFWEDAGGTAFPPGTWMTFGQVVSARDSHSIDEDAVLFFGLANAAFDAGIAAWEAKTYYDYARPVRVIRALGSLGLLNEGATGVDALTGETGFVIEAWGGPGQGTQTILAKNFITYQTPNSHPSPPFAEYVSGHSTFSGAGAAVLSYFTNSDRFGASVTFDTGNSRFEPGLVPAETLTLGWDTFTEAADEGGMSRLYGGIHFEDGDINGRQLGRDVGKTVWAEIQRFADALAPVVALTEEKLELPTDEMALMLSKYRTRLSFSRAIAAGGVELLLSFAEGTAVLGSDFTLSLEDSENVLGLKFLEDGHSALVSVAEGATYASLAMTPTLSAEHKTIKTRLVDALGYRVLEADGDRLIAPVLDGFVETETPGIFSLQEDLVLDVSVLSPDNNKLAGEVVLFSVDDAGRVNGIRPGEAGYLDEILSGVGGDRIQTTFSVLARSDAEDFAQAAGSRMFSRKSALSAGTQLGFMLVEDGSVDELRRNSNSRNVLFSTQSGVQKEWSSTGGSLLTFGDDESSFGSLAIRTAAFSLSAAKAAFNSTGFAEAGREMLDLRTVDADTLNARVTVYSEAAFDNLVGFYKTNERGDVLDAANRVVAMAGTDSYRRAVVDHRLAATVSRKGTYDLSLTGRSMLGTFIIADGSLESFDLDRLYVSSIGSNADRSDHIRMLGDNVFGFEDMKGGGDRDFDDMIVSVEFA